MSLKDLSDKELMEYYRLAKANEDSGSSDRKQISDKFGEDTKFLYHIIRLMDEAEQILLEGELDLQRSKESMKSVRRGDWSIEQIQSWMMEKEKALEVAYTNCKLPVRPDYQKLRQLLYDCLEEHYGSLSACVSNPDWSIMALRELDEKLNAYRSRLYEN